MVYIPQPVSLPSVHPRRLFLRPGIIVRRLCFPRGVRGLLFLPPPCLAPRGTRACVGLRPGLSGSNVSVGSRKMGDRGGTQLIRDRKSTRLNSSHLVISYAVFCLKKKKIKTH